MRYIEPLREGGSLPALAEADDGFRYVVKFRGAGHGTKALVSELVGGLVAARMGLRVPELVFVDVDEDFGRTEGDEEIQDLLKASQGLNLGLHFLQGAFTFDPVVNTPDALAASIAVWTDAFLTNVDRTFRNTNILWWHSSEMWFIDHGASLYFHHSWRDLDKAPLTPFAYIRDHALLRQATMLDRADAIAHELLSEEFIAEVVDVIPSEWLEYEGTGLTPDEIRSVYKQFLVTRLKHSDIFVAQAENERRALV